MIEPFNGIFPKIHPSSFVAPNAWVLGDVEMGEDCSIWFGSVVRGDVHKIRIGNRVNIQDMSLLHVTKDRFSLTIEDNVSLGHRVTLHGCHLKSHSFVGMGATIMDGVVLGEYSFVGAGSLVTPGKIIPPNVLLMGSPAKIVREISEAEKAIIENTYRNYVKYKANYESCNLVTNPNWKEVITNISLGTDIVENERIKEGLERFGEKILLKLFSEDEIEYCSKKKDPSPYFAARFAAKEAFIKALKLERGQVIDMKEIELSGREFGKKTLVIHGKAKELFLSKGFRRIESSVSHSEHYSVAQVLLIG